MLQRIAPSHDLASSFEQSSGTYHMSTSGSASRFDFAQAISDELHQISNLPPWVTAATGGRPFILQRLIPITSAEYAMPATRPLYSVLSRRTALGDIWDPTARLAHSVAQRIRRFLRVMLELRNVLERYFRYLQPAFWFARLYELYLGIIGASVATIPLSSVNQRALGTADPIEIRSGGTASARFCASKQL